MADQKRWWKLWHSALSDDAVICLSPAIRWAWAALGAHTKVHGTKGRVVINESNIVLAAQMGVPTEDLRATIEGLPHVTVRCVNCVTNPCAHCVNEESKNRHGEFTVTWHNWTYYQEDSTQAERQRASRSKRRGEENKKREVNSSARTGADEPANGLTEWPEEWGAIRNLVTGESALPFLAQHKQWLGDLDWWVTMKALFSSCPAPLSNLVTEAAAYIQGEGYKPRSKAGIRQKLKNCMEFAAKKAERSEPNHARSSQYPRL
jgi:hypothetical protein